MERPLAVDHHPDTERDKRFRVPSERQLINFLRHGRASISSRLAALPVDISSLYEFGVKPPRYVWIETDYRSFTRVVVSSGQNQLPSRKISDQFGNQVPAVQTLELKGAWQLRVIEYDDQHGGGNHFNVELSVFDPNTGKVREEKGTYRQI